MTSHAAIAIGFGLLAVVGLGLQVRARRHGHPCSFGTLVTWLLSTRSGRIGVFAGWAWLGLHLFG